MINKKTRVIDNQYLKWIDSQPCVITYQQATHHHFIGHGFRGGKYKVDDYLCFPLSYLYHTGDNGIHTIGVKSWEKKHGLQWGFIRGTLFKAIHENVITTDVFKKYMNIVLEQDR